MSLTRPLKDSDDLLKLDEKELDELCHELVSYEFNFAKKMATELSGGKETKELEKNGD